MRVLDWMSPDPVTITPATEVAEARRLLRHYGIRHLPVVEDGRVAGMVSDRDVRVEDPALRRLADRLAAEGQGALDEVLGAKRTIDAIMSAPAHVIGVQETVEAAARLMLSRRISALPVVDAHGLVVGVITTTDCLLASLTPPEPPDAPERRQTVLSGGPR